MNPDDLRQRYEQARAWHASGQFAAAERAYREVLSHVPGEAAVLRDLAWALFAQDQVQAAADQIRAAVELAPAQAEFHCDLGTMLARLKQTEPAIAAFEQSLKLAPNNLAAHFNLGNAYFRLGQTANAIASFRRATELDPQDADSRLNLGIALKDAGQLAEARNQLNESLRLRPRQSAAWIQFGSIASMEGEFPQAIDCFGQAAAQAPADAAPHFQRALAHRSCNDLEGAITALQRALALQPDHPGAQRLLGECYEAEGRLELAREVFSAAQRNASDDGLRIKSALVLPVILDSAEQLGEVRARLDLELTALEAQSLRIDDPPASIGVPAPQLAYHGEQDRGFQKRIASLVLKAAPQLGFVAPHCDGRRVGPHGKRIRLGFFSANLRAHTIGKLNCGLIEQLNREQFEVMVFGMSSPSDPLARRIAAAAAAQVTLPRDLAGAVGKVSECELDALIYTDIGLESFSYYLAHARLAPVQCVTWGHPLTTGIETLDYFISSAELDHEDATEHYTEQLVRLPHLSNYYFRPAAPLSTKTREDFGLTRQAHVYGCLQSAFKLHPDDDRVFGEILRGDPDGVLAILAGNFPHWTELLRRRFERTMPDVISRIRFVPHQTPDDFARLLSLCDVLLDPQHFGGGETSYQSFAVGTPVVARQGRYLRSRITSALYRWMGLDDAIVITSEALVRRALLLGRDVAARNAARDQILAVNGTIYENPAGVRELETFLANAVETSGSRSNR